MHVQSGVTLTCPPSASLDHATLTVTDPLAGTVYVVDIGSPDENKTRAPSHFPPLMTHDELVPAVATVSMTY